MIQGYVCEKIMKTLTALAALVDDTRGNYVSKEQLKNILGKKYKVDTKPTKAEAKPSEESKAESNTTAEESPKAATQNEKAEEAGRFRKVV
jgi:hypothetical protein